MRAGATAIVGGADLVAADSGVDAKDAVALLRPGYLLATRACVFANRLDVRDRIVGINRQSRERVSEDRRTRPLPSVMVVEATAPSPFRRCGTRTQGGAERMKSDSYLL